MYSTSRGTSLDRLSLTLSDRPLALQKLTRYFSEKVRETGSLRSMETFSLAFSTLVCCLSWTEPEPMSPWQLNLTPSFVHSIDTATVSVCPVLSYPILSYPFLEVWQEFMITYPTRTRRSGLCRCAGTRPKAW